METLEMELIEVFKKRGRTVKTITVTEGATNYFIEVK